MSKDFNPIKPNRKPREDGWSEETEEFYELLQERGDQRIGQLIINAIRERYGENAPAVSSRGDMSEKKAFFHDRLWNMEAEELVRLIENLYEKHQDDDKV